MTNFILHLVREQICHVFKGVTQVRILYFCCQRRLLVQVKTKSFTISVPLLPKIFPQKTTFRKQECLTLLVCVAFMIILITQGCNSQLYNNGVCYNRVQANIVNIEVLRYFFS